MKILNNFDRNLTLGTNYIFFVYMFFLTFITIFLWTTVFSSAAAYLTFLSSDVASGDLEVHWISIFLELHYPNEAMIGKNINELVYITLPTIFVTDVHPIYFEFRHLQFFAYINSEYYQIILTKWMYIATLIILVQIPLFYISIRTALRKAFDIVETSYIVETKLDENYLSDKITQTIASNIHHELKTPLAALDALVVKNKALVGYIVELIGESCGDCAIRKHSSISLAKKYSLTLDSDGTLIYDSIERKLITNFTLMEDSIRNMFNTVNMIKTLKNIDETSKNSLYEIIETSINIFKMGSTYNFTSIIDPKLKLCYLEKLDPQALSNIIINHTKNSLEANAQIIKFEYIKSLPDTSGGNQNFLKLNIIDDGHGISKDIIKNIYAIKTSTKLEGSGVGLYICKTILNKFNGDEKIMYTDKYGTVFELRIPVKTCK